MSHTVRTTMRPDEEIEVSDAELRDLRRQGLLLQDEAPDEAPANLGEPEAPKAYHQRSRRAAATAPADESKES